jgi:hypothetical protein
MHPLIHDRAVQSTIFLNPTCWAVTINIDKALMLPAPSEPKEKENSKIHSEVMLFLEQANRGPGKEKGRTGDKGRVPDISDTVVSVYFRQSIQGLKEKMLQGVPLCQGSCPLLYFSSIYQVGGIGR